MAGQVEQIGFAGYGGWGVPYVTQSGSSRGGMRAPTTVFALMENIGWALQKPPTPENMDLPFQGRRSDEKRLQESAETLASPLRFRTTGSLERFAPSWGGSMP